MHCKNSISDRKLSLGHLCCTIEVMFLAAHTRVLVRRKVVTSIVKWVKNTRQSRTPLCLGRLHNLFVGMPPLCYILKVVDDHKPFVIFRLGMEGVERVYGCNPLKDNIL